ncbi:MAG: hypothetical protein KJO08_04355, partial [Gammaproteobacteria bacterium]|nr:hypothetical protein [Gammaproteobacteria bacterium]
LEEPPGNIVFILIADRSDRLPITIRSRCQFLDFPLPPRELVIPWLTKQLPPDADAELLLAAAGGAPLLAMDYWEENTLQERMRVNGELTDLLAGKADPLGIAARWKTLGCAILLPWLIGYVTDLIRLRFTYLSAASGDNGAFGVRKNTETLYSDAMGEVARKIDLLHGYHLFDRCLEARRMWEDAVSLNELLLLEGLAIDFSGDFSRA